MVVSVEISGVLEEKLRRLVDLGIYASVSEAVRDAVRKLLSQLDLKSIAVDLLINRGCSLHYACEFSNTTCNEFIEYLLIRNITPTLGNIGNPKTPSTHEKIIMDPSSIFVAYNTGMYKIINKINDIITLYIPSIIENYYLILKSAAIRAGMPINHDLQGIDIPEKKPPSKLLLTTSEFSIIKFVDNLDYKILTDDIFIQRYLEKNNISYYSSISLLKLAKYLNIINDIEEKEVELSLKSLPYIYRYS